MKKLLFVILIVAGFSTMNAQELGLRFGNVSGGNVAIDGVFSMGDFSRLHADISFGNGVGIDVLWDFLYRPLSGEAFYWYVGAGPYTYIGDPFALGLAAEAGLEYHFNGVPIAVGLDWRPYVELIETTSLNGGGFGVNVRYVF